MTNILDIRSVLLAKHAQHVVLIHFPIALFLSGVFFDLLSRGKPESAFATAARVNITAAAITAFPAFFTGILAWRYALEGQRIHGLLLYHIASAATSTVLIALCCLLRNRLKGRTLTLLALDSAGVISIAVTAHLGGFLSGVNT